MNTVLNHWKWIVVLGLSGWLGGCTAPGLVASAVGVATDTSITWEVVKHVHGKLTEGDPIACARLDGLQRALNPRCGPYVSGRITAAELRSAGLQGCVLAVALRDPRVWPAVPDLLDAGAQASDCDRSPWVDLASAPGCPDFSVASPAAVVAMRSVAEEDPRAVRYDVVRMLTCPAAVRAGLDQVLATWLMRGWLDPDEIGFGVFGALHPSFLTSSLARLLESKGHDPRAGFGYTDGTQPAGFELALRQADWKALDWWIARMPTLVDRVPAPQANQLPWVPLAKVVGPNFLARPEARDAVVGFLIARGADPRRKLPYDTGRSVVDYARSIGSPAVALLESPARAPAVPLATLVAGAVPPSSGR